VETDASHKDSADDTGKDVADDTGDVKNKGDDGTENGDVEVTPGGVVPRDVGADDDTEDGDVEITPGGVVPRDGGADDDTKDGGVEVTPGGVASGVGKGAGPDLFTKPLQGAALVKYRKLILSLNDGGPEVDTPIDHRSVLDKVLDEEVIWAPYGRSVCKGLTNGFVTDALGPVDEPVAS
jgi:hypothetical protein